MLALAMLHVFGAQHQVREVDVPGMRRNVRTLRHEAHVTQVTVIDDVPVDLLVDAIELERLDSRRSRRTRSGRNCTGRSNGDSRGRCRRRARALSRARPRRRTQRSASRADDAREPAGCPRVCRYLPRPRSVAVRWSRGPSGSDSRASVRPSRAFRTSRRSRRILLRAPASPCPGTCRCTRASRRRSPP